MCSGYLEAAVGKHLLVGSSANGCPVQCSVEGAGVIEHLWEPLSLQLTGLVGASPQAPEGGQEEAAGRVRWAEAEGPRQQ